MTAPHRPDVDQTVVLAEETDLDVLSHVIAKAFVDLAPSRWLITDLGACRRILPGYFRLYLEHAQAVGLACTTPGRTAAALWLPVGEGPVSPPDGYDARLAAATGAWADRFRAFDAALDDHHPTGTAHWHLAILAVHPDQQGQGTGTTLLHSVHERLDHARMPAYLEASSPRARDLYLRHGYVLRPDAPYHLPSGGPPMWPMWRQPRMQRFHVPVDRTDGDFELVRELGCGQPAPDLEQEEDGGAGTVRST